MTIQFSGDQASQLLRGFAGGGTKKNKHIKSGIDCPSCETGELLFTEPNIIHHDPYRKRVKCGSCDYKGFEAIEP